MPTEGHWGYRKLWRAIAVFTVLPLCVSLVVIDALALESPVSVNGEEAIAAGAIAIPDQDADSAMSGAREKEAENLGALPVPEDMEAAEQPSVDDDESSVASHPQGSGEQNMLDNQANVGAMSAENEVTQEGPEQDPAKDEVNLSGVEEPEEVVSDVEPLPTGASFFNVPATWKPLTCNAGYVVTENGRFIRDGVSVLEVVTERIAPNATRVDALGISPGGMEAFVVVERSQTFSIYRYTGAKGWMPWIENLRKSEYLPRFSFGMVDVLTQDYYFGGYDPNRQSFRFWKMENRTKKITQGGSFRPNQDLVNAARAGRAVDADIAMYTRDEIQLFAGVGAGNGGRGLDVIYSIRVSDLFNGNLTSTPHVEVRNERSADLTHVPLSGVGYYVRSKDESRGEGAGYRRNRRISIYSNFYGPPYQGEQFSNDVVISDAASCGDLQVVSQFSNKISMNVEEIAPGISSHSALKRAPFTFRFKVFPTSLDPQRPLPLEYVNRYTLDFADCDDISCTDNGDYDPRQGIASVLLPALPLTPETEQGAHYCVAYYDYDVKNAYKKKDQIGPFENGLKADSCWILNNKNLQAGVLQLGDVHSLRPKLSDVYFTLLDNEEQSIRLPGSEWRLEGVNIPSYGWPSTVNIEVPDCVAGEGRVCGNVLLKDSDDVAGQFRLHHLQPGTYTLTQTKAPHDYIPLAAPIVFTIDADDANYRYNSVRRLINLDSPVNHYKISTIKGVVNLYEEDGFALVNGENRSGIEWSFVREGEPPYADISPAEVGRPQESALLRSRSDGTFGEGWKLSHPTPAHVQRISMRTTAPTSLGYEAFKYDCYKKGRYRISTGYIQNNQIFSINVPRNTQVDCEFSYRKTSGTLKWEKVSSNSVHLKGSSWKIEALDTPAANGFPLTIDDCAVPVGREGACVYKLRGDRDPREGYFEVAGLPYGRYRLIERLAPKGYQRSPLYQAGGPAQTRTLTPEQRSASFGSIVNRTVEENGQLQVSLTVQVEGSDTSDFTSNGKVYKSWMEASSTGAPATFTAGALSTNPSRTQERQIALGRTDSKTIRLDKKNDRVDVTAHVEVQQAPPLEFRSLSCVSGKADGAANPKVYLEGNAQSLNLMHPTSFTIRNLPDAESVNCTLVYRPVAITSTVTGIVKVVDDGGIVISQAGENIDFAVAVGEAEKKARFNSTGEAQRSLTQRSATGGTFADKWTLFHLNPKVQPRLRFEQRTPEGANLTFTSLVCRNTITNDEVYRSTEASLPGESSAISPNTPLSCEITYKRQVFGSLEWSKVDADDLSKVLPGSGWRVKPVGPSVMAAQGIVVNDCVGTTAEACSTQADKDHREGYFRVSNVPIGTYDLIEEQSPVGYAAGPKKTLKLEDTSQPLNLGPQKNTSTLPEITVTAEIIELDGNGERERVHKHAGYTVDVTATKGVQHISPSTPNNPLVGKQALSGENWEVDTSWKLRLDEGGTAASFAVDSTVSPRASGYQRVLLQCQPDVDLPDFKNRATRYTDGELSVTDVPAGARVHCVFVYAPEGYQLPVDLKWRKTDAEGQGLTGSEWSLEGRGQHLSIVDCAIPDQCDGTNDSDPTPGVLRVQHLKPGEYTLAETKAPLGYAVGAPRQVRVEAQREYTDLGDIVNRVITPPSLPLTGGMSSDALMFSGAGFLGLAGAGWLLSRRRGKA